MTPNIMIDPSDISRFLRAGRAVLTLKSGRTGQHFTFRVSEPKNSNGSDRRFVSVLTGPDQYSYLGLLDGTAFRTTRKSTFAADAPAVRGFAFFVGHLARDVIPAGLEVRHEGRCGCCGRELTHPTSIDRGIGPECWEKRGYGSMDRRDAA